GTSSKPATLVSSLIERATRIGAYVEASAFEVDTCALRSTQPDPSTGDHGRGLEATDVDAVRANLVVTGSSIEFNTEYGVTVLGSDLVVKASVVRDTQPRPTDGRLGLGIGALNDGLRSTIDVEGSVFERNHLAAVAIGGSDAVIDTTVLRGTEVEPGTGD